MNVRSPLRLLVALVLLAACAAPASNGNPGPGEGPTLAGCQVFPADHVWNTPVDQLPVHPSSSLWVNTIGAQTGVHPDFGEGLWEGAPIGIPYATVGAGQPKVPVSFYYAAESDPGPYPIPEDSPVEGAPPGGVATGGDRHVLVVNVDDCVLYELFDAVRQADGSWQAGSGAVYDLSDYELRPAGFTSADAAGLPILPGLVRYEEVAAGVIAHALRFTAPQTANRYVWPARHQASSRSGEEYPPMGARFRLKADFDASGFSAEAQVIVEALKRYGMILADNGSAWYLSGAPDDRWSNPVLRELRQIQGSDFEAVDASSLMLDPDSGKARQ